MLVAAGPQLEPKVPEPRVELDPDRVPKTKTHGNVLIQGGTVLPVSGPRRERTDVLVRDGKIAAIGKDLEAPEGVARIDARGRFVVPGAIDCHSHIARIFRALAGGTTSAHLLHGSGNPIGGQDAVIKLRWGKRASELVFQGAPQGIKFALGENPTRQQGFPQTRMGMAATYRREFTEARAYARSLREHEEKRARGEESVPPRRDLRLEAVANVLSGKIRVHCHCYREDEILAFLQVCEEFGVKGVIFQHILEGYKIADELRRAGASCSTFSDWWAYKVEAFDAVPGNAAILTRAGVLTSINSDSHELIRHLFLEAAKCVRYGDLTEEEALALVTVNAARQLGIEGRSGTIEVGKDADLAIWNGHPLSSYSHPILTLVDGEVFFERAEGERGTEGERGLPDPRTFAIPADPGPAPEPPSNDRGLYAIVGARVEPVSSAPLARATVVVRDGKISLVGADARVPAGATVIDGKGLTVTPGFIEAGSWIGLVEISALKVTRDASDSGEFQPDLVALTGVFPPSEHVKVARAAGITLGLATPSGGLVPGQASVIRLDGWTPEEMKVRERAALVVEFPSRPGAPPEGGARPKKHDRLELLEKLFDKAKEDLERRERARGTDATIPPDTRLEAMAPYLRGELPVLLHAEDARTILDALQFAERRKLKPAILGGRDSWKVATLLAERRVPVLLGPVLDYPWSKEEPYDAGYSCAAELARAGVQVAIRSGGSQMTGPRNLPFEAAMAASYGLGRERALAAITKVPAEILGLSKERGTIEPGKVADLVVSLGDPLEPTSRIRYVFIDGKPVSLESKQTRLEAQARARIDANKRIR
ncbi:amidohydrolase family protein [bacterium]|nr:amidohydrolase family protein [bacterium]